MDPQFLEALGQISPAKADRYADTFAVNTAGDIVVLCADGLIRYANIRNRGNTNSSSSNEQLPKFNVLPVRNLASEDVQQFSHVEFDSGGSLLLLWSRDKIGMIEINPQECIRDGMLHFPRIEDSNYSNCNGSSCSYTELSDHLQQAAGDTVDAAASRSIAKVAFHSLCAHCIVVLFERDCLLLLDLRSLEVQVHSTANSISTNSYNNNNSSINSYNNSNTNSSSSNSTVSGSSGSSDGKFVSFCFGPRVDWLAFSLLLLTASGQVFLLCPIIPKGAAVTTAVVSDLWVWLDQLSAAFEAELGDNSSSSSGSYEAMDGTTAAAFESVAYVNLVQAFLRETFGPRPATTTDAAAAADYSQQQQQQQRAATADGFIRAGEKTESFSQLAQLNYDTTTAATTAVVGADLFASSLSADAAMLCGYSVKLIGPLRLLPAAAIFNNAAAATAAAQFPQHDVASAEEKDSGSNSSSSKSIRTARVVAQDICVPGYAATIANSSSSSNNNSSGALQMTGAPVLAVVSSNGDVNILLFDADGAQHWSSDNSSSYSSAAAAAAAVVSFSYAGPSWRPIDLHQPLLLYPLLPALLPVDRINTTARSYKTPVTAATAAAVASTSARQWRLLPDPVLAHCIHVYSDCCELYLISCQWLKAVISGLNTAPAELAATAAAAGESSEPFAALLAPCTVLPVFDLNHISGQSTTTTATRAGSSSSSREAKSSSDKNSSSSTDAAAVVRTATVAALSGLRVVCDALLGHAVIFKAAKPTGVACAINLSTYIKLVELQNDLDPPTATATTAAAAVGAVGDGFGEAVREIKRDLAQSMNAEQLRWRHAQSLILRVTEGLKDVPIVGNSSSDPIEAEAQNKKILLQTAGKLESKVLIPLNELAQHTMFNLEMLTEELHAQSEILDGISTATATTSAAATVSASQQQQQQSTLSVGLQRLGEQLFDQHEELNARVERMQRRFQQQQQRVEQLATFAISKRSKMSKAEHVYAHQLQEWSLVVSRMNQQLQALRQMAQAQTHATATTSPMRYTTATAASGYAATTGAAAASSSGGVMLSSAGQRSKPVVGWRPAGGMVNHQHFGYRSINNNSNNSSSFGGLGSGSSNVNSPVAATAASRGTSALNLSGSSTPFSTPHSAQSTPMRSFSARPPLTSATTTAATTATPPRFAGAHVFPGSTGSNLTPQQQQQQRRQGTSTASATSPASLLLSPEDQSACTELLKSQADLLEKAEAEVKALETRLQRLQQQQQQQARTF